MKILKPGYFIADNTHTCSKCGCKFMYNSKTDVLHDRDGYYINCPYCNNYINIYKNFGEIIR